MKKVILIAAIVIVAIVGLTSYNGKEMKRDNNGDDRLIAQVNTELPGEIAGGNKKKD
jgi:hypothetical protein